MLCVSDITPKRLRLASIHIATSMRVFRDATVGMIHEQLSADHDLRFSDALDKLAAQPYAVYALESTIGEMTREIVMLDALRMALLASYPTPTPGASRRGKNPDA